MIKVGLAMDGVHPKLKAFQINNHDWLVKGHHHFWANPCSNGCLSFWDGYPFSVSKNPAVDCLVCPGPPGQRRLRKGVRSGLCQIWTGVGSAPKASQVGPRETTRCESYRWGSKTHTVIGTRAGGDRPDLGCPTDSFSMDSVGNWILQHLNADKAWKNAKQSQGPYAGAQHLSLNPSSCVSHVNVSMSWIDCFNVETVWNELRGVQPSAESWQVDWWSLGATCSGLRCRLHRLSDLLRQVHYCKHQNGWCLAPLPCSWVILRWSTIAPWLWGAGLQPAASKGGSAGRTVVQLPRVTPSTKNNARRPGRFATGFLWKSAPGQLILCESLCAVLHCAAPVCLLQLHVLQ